jgi:electron transport complex protein RnfC
VCPARLLPQQLFAYLVREDWPRVQQHRLDACIECGCCAISCPSQIPLVEWYRWGKQELREQARSRQQATASRKRFEVRDARLRRTREERAAQHPPETTAVAAPTISKAEVLAAIARGRARRERRAPGHPPDESGRAR